MRLIALTLVSGLLALAANAQTTALVGGKVWTGTEAGTLEQATVLIEDDRIVAIGDDVEIPAGSTVVEVDGKWVTPGIIAPFSRVGLVEVGAEDDTNDTSAAQTQFSVALDASKAFNPSATPVDVTRIEGVTSVVVAPSTSTSIFAGRGFVANTSASHHGSIRIPRAFQYMEMGENGAALAGGSRAALWRYLDGAIFDARTFPGRYMAHDLGDSLNRADAQAFIPVVRGDMALMIAAHRASDLQHIIDLKLANPRLNIIVVGADEGWRVARELAAAGIPVIVDPFQNLPASFEQLGATSQNAQRLIDAGVRVAFAHLGDNGHQARLVLQSAGNAVANGVDHDAALAAITTIPASVFGLEDYGTIEEGKRADVVIWSGDPLEVMTTVDAVYIDGEEQSLESRQTKLRDRYLELDESNRPMAYRR